MTKIFPKKPNKNRFSVQFLADPMEQTNIAEEEVVDHYFEQVFTMFFFFHFSGVSFEFDYASVSTTAMALLQEDPQLDKMR